MKRVTGENRMNRKQGNCRPSVTGLCRRIAWVVAVAPTLILAIGAGQVAWADHNPATCTRTGPALLLTELRDLDQDGIGETPITGDKINGETIYYQATLFQSSPIGQCAYQGGALCIDPPGAAGCTDVTPIGGIPLLCDNPLVCNPDGVPAVDSRQLPYVVNAADRQASGDCNGQIRAVARYTGGTSHFTTDVSPVNADTPICNPVQFCGDGIVNVAGETCDPPGSNAGLPNECRANCTFCGDGVQDAGEQCDDHNNISGDGCSASCVREFCGDGIVGNTPGEQCDDGNNVDGDGCSSTCQNEQTCELAVTKTCAVPQPLAPFVCSNAKPIHSLTMQWEPGSS